MNATRRTALIIFASLALTGWAHGRVADGPEAHVDVGQVDPERTAFVLLIGQPRAPGLPLLTAVPSDVAMMHAFFGTLSPAHSYVHLPSSDVRAQLVSDDTSVADPTWAAIEASVREISDALDALDGAADVYVYYAGHGRTRRVARHTQTDLFLQPDADGGGPGYDGILSTRLLHDGVLGPIDGSDRRVHLVVDACQSAYLLEARGMRQTLRIVKAPTKVEPKMIEEFTERYGRVGALLATQGSQLTYESARTGGLFSYAVRTAGIGAADLDGDGRVTYGELGQIMPRILSQRAGASAPTLLAPGDRSDVAFIDYRGRAAASVTFDPEEATRYELKSMYFEPYAALYPSGDRPVRVFLPDGAAFLASARIESSGPRVWSRFQAANQLFAALQQPFEDRRTSRNADLEVPPLVMQQPLTPDDYIPVPDPHWVHVPRRYTTLAFSGVGETPLFGATLNNSPLSSAWGAEVTGALGEGLDQFTWRLSYTRRYRAWIYSELETTYIVGHTPRLSLGYQRLLAELAFVELSGGGFGSAGMSFEQRAENRPDVSGADVSKIPLIEAGAELTARVLLPRTAWALRADMRVSGQVSLDETTWFDVMSTASMGFEYEFALD